MKIYDVVIIGAGPRQVFRLDYMQEELGWIL